MNVVSIAATARGRAMARRLPYAHVDGLVASALRSRWADVDGFVVFAATGIVVRVIGPLLSDKHRDPAVVCVDEAGRWVIALTGGHAGANDLARDVAAILGAEAIVTTATDVMGSRPLDGVGGCRAVGDVAAVSRALLDGEEVWIDNRLGWSLPDDLVAGCHVAAPSAAGASAATPSGPGIVVTDAAVPPAAGTVVLHPPTLVVGTGTSSTAPASDLHALATNALAAAGLSPESVWAIATIDRRRDAPAVVALARGWAVPIRDLPADQLASVAVPNPSAVVADAVGTPSVAEAAALHAAGPGASLVVEKQASATATVAIARRLAPPGHLAVVGIGPGDPSHRTPAATAAVRHADVVIGYGPYVDLVADAIAPAATVVRSPIGDETVRAKHALVEAAAGRQVALVCSGDAGVYALATLVFELSGEFGADVAIDVVPGVTAAVASAAVLGAPLGHDHVAISLSDLLTPWEVIARRLQAAAEGDFVVSLYNPRSAGRQWQLTEAIAILATQRSPSTPVGVVTDAGRPGQRAVVTPLASFDPSIVTMTTCVIVGSSTTRMIGDRMMTPRGYVS